jgi:hypothetical protein
VDDDLILRAQYHHPNTGMMRRKRPDTPALSANTADTSQI